MVEQDTSNVWVQVRILGKNILGVISIFSLIIFSYKNI